MNAFLSQAEFDAMDDVAHFGCDLHESDLDKAIEAKRRTYKVEILLDGRVVAEERGVRAMTLLEAAQMVMRQTPGNFGFRPVAQ